MRELKKDSDSPLVELTEAAVASADYVVRGAAEHYLGNLTEAAVIGLSAYAKDPSTDLLTVAADMDDQVDALIDDMIPTLVTHRPELAGPLEVLSIGNREAEHNGSLYGGYSSGPWLRELQADATPSVPRAFHILLKDEWRDESDIEEVFREATYRDPSKAVTTFVEGEWSKLSNGASKDSLLEDWLTR